MKITNLRHTGLAYVLLAAILCAVWLLAVSPLLAVWHQHQARSSALAVEIADIKAGSAHTQASLAGWKDEVKTLIADGSLAGLSRPGEAAHRLQMVTKLALAQASAKVSQLRPETTAFSPWLVQSKLTIDFRINSSKLDRLLQQLASNSPGLQLESLNLRRLASSTPGNPADLEASAQTTLWFMSEALEKLMSPVDKPEADDSVTAQSYDQPARLAGLFDATYRSRLQKPDTGDYRLTAITLSADSRIAVITDLATGISRRLREGDMLDGWKILAIGSSSVKLAAGEQLGRLDLQKK